MPSDKKQINLRVTDEEYDRIKGNAAAVGMTQSQWLRERLLGKGSPTVAQSEAYLDEVDRAVKAVRAVLNGKKPRS